jgi:uncharacterized protein (DUF433 family)
VESQVTAVFATQVELDERGIAWLAGTKVKVLEVALDKIAHGWSPDEIHFQHPHLSLAQIHAALTWYYENREDIDEQIAAAAKEAGRLALEVSDPVFRRKLIEQKQSF